MRRTLYNQLLVAIVLLGALSFVSATVVSFNFDLSLNSSVSQPGLVYADSVVFQVSTTKDALCRYSTTKGTTFNLMQGVFDDNLEIIHKKTLAGLSDGVYRYYVRCREVGQINNNSQGLNELEAIFRINNPIAAEISIDQKELGVGTHEIDVTLTKVPLGTPKLSYTYDDSTYKTIVLYGSGKNWKGSLIIPDSPLEAVGRFRFEARDLENRIGTKITGDKSFEVDTMEPAVPGFLEATGEFGQIRLEWHNPEKDEDTINVYRSQNPPVKITSFYKSIDGDREHFTDTDVSSGKTYYYRIAFEDKAGNVGELSREVVATTRLRNTSSTRSTLSHELVPSVDALLTEVDLLESDIERSKATFDAESDSDKVYLDMLEVSDSLQSSLSGITALRREADGLKSQDLQKVVLDSKLSSIRSRMNILRRGVPDSFTVFDAQNVNHKSSDESLRTAILEARPELLPETIDTSVSASAKQAGEAKFQVKTSATVVEIIFLDGSRDSQTVIEHVLEGLTNLANDTIVTLELPQGILSNARLSMSTADYSQEKDTLYTFDVTTEKIIYTINKKVSEEDVRQIKINPIRISEAESFLTGYFLSELPSPGSMGMVFLIIVAGSLGVYLLYVRRRSHSDAVHIFLDKAKQVKDLKRQGRIQESNKLYMQLKADYLALSDEEKSKVFKEVKHLTIKK